MFDGLCLKIRLGANPAILVSINFLFFITYFYLVLLNEQKVLNILCTTKCSRALGCCEVSEVVNKAHKGYFGKKI